MKQNRSTIDIDTLDEQINAEDSAKWSTLQNTQQYYTPEWLVRKIAAKLKAMDKLPGWYSSVIDPQCGNGNLLSIGKQENNYHPSALYGLDIDKREIDSPIAGKINKVRMDTVKATEILQKIVANENEYVTQEEYRFFTHAFCNPPFGKRWKVGDDVVDSSVHTWNWATRYANTVVFISNRKTIEKNGWDKDENTLSYWTEVGCWDNCDVEVGIVIWHNGNARSISKGMLDTAWKELTAIAEEQSKHRPKWNIYTTASGKLKVYLSRLTKVEYKLSREDVLRLNGINDAHPLALVAEKETRDLMREMVESGKYLIEPDAKTAIDSALAEAEEAACPITPPTEFMMTAYADEEEALECVDPMGMDLTKGKTYPITTGTYSFNQRFTRKKTHYDAENDEMYTREHECAISGQDRYVMVKDDNGQWIQFKRHADTEKKAWEICDSKLFQVFKRPNVQCLATRYKDKYTNNLSLLSTCELIGGFEYYPGQKDYLARVGIKDYGQIAADVGTGKSLMAISLIAMKAPKRTLICAPRGTIKGEDGEEHEYNPSQWVSEIHKFAPYMTVFELFNMEDYYRIIKLNNGKLPMGVYITYYEALTLNKSMESVPASWDDVKLHAEMCRKLGVDPKDEKYLNALKVSDDEDSDNVDPSWWSKRIGQDIEGIRCVITPNMATMIGDNFDCVILDENHYACNLDSLRTKALIRLQPKFRYGLSATPIPNRVDNMFSIMGWLCVPDWYRGNRRNAAWPYANDEMNRFQATFLTKERDFTREQDKRKDDRNWNGKCETVSPVIASPARLLKLISPTLSFINKEKCNPNLVSCTVRDVRVPLGLEQAKLYSHFLQRSNIPGKNPLVIARKQSAYLRGICADPMGFDTKQRGGPEVTSNMNPKIMATLKLILELNAKGEQVVVVSSRVGISNTIADLLEQAGITYSRIDSTVSPDNHSTQSNLFKQKKTEVMLMGIKCAVGYSFPECPNEIITSLEWSYGTKAQAEGRVFRVNSKFPVNIWCILHADTIEELMFDKVATKKDAATICLHGERIDVDFKPIDMNELISEAGNKFNIKASKEETEVERELAQVLAEHKNNERKAA